MEYDLWTGSDHDLAMDFANDSTVRGDFNDAEFEYKGQIHKFYKKDNKYFVYTDGPDGNMQEFEITYTFGVRPLQQYLIQFDGGRYRLCHCLGHMRKYGGIIWRSCLFRRGFEPQIGYTGPTRHKTGTECAQIATPPIWQRI